MVIRLALVMSIAFFPQSLVMAEVTTCVYVEEFQPHSQHPWTWMRQRKAPVFKLESEIKKECYVVVDPKKWTTHRL